MTKKRSIFSVALSIGLLGLLGVGTAIQAAADTIIDSNASTFSIAADNLLPTSEGKTIQDVTTLGSGWAAAISNASGTTNWISPLADQGNGTSGTQNITGGSVTYQTQFTLSGLVDMSILYAADDWTNISLNGTTIYNGPAGCGAVATTCTSDPASYGTDQTLTFDNLTLSGPNTLTFTVSNTGGGSDAGGGPTGLDAQITLTAVPEPSSLLLLGSGMLTAGGFIRRRFMRS